MHPDLLLVQQSIFSPRGEVAAVLSRLGIILTIVAILAVLIVTGLIAVAMRRRGVLEAGTAPLAAFRASDHTGRRWVMIGATVAFVILIATGIYSIRVILHYSAGFDRADLTLDVTARQYWWEVRYPSPEGAEAIIGANEIHVPVGRRIRINLHSGDVIHSLWIPALGGKTDLIPGRQLAMWFTADTAGVYHGQCAEYCGISHANMLLTVIAESPEAWQTWRMNQQLRPAPDTAVTRIFQQRGCAACHRVAGQMDGQGGPDLTHIASRASLAAGVVPNSAAGLRAWLRAPQAMKPGTRMPRTGLSDGDLDRLVAYLRSLK